MSSVGPAVTAAMFCAGGGLTVLMAVPMSDSVDPSASSTLGMVVFDENPSHVWHKTLVSVHGLQQQCPAKRWATAVRSTLRAGVGHGRALTTCLLPLAFPQGGIWQGLLPFPFPQGGFAHGPFPFSLPCKSVTKATRAASGKADSTRGLSSSPSHPGTVAALKLAATSSDPSVTPRHVTEKFKTSTATRSSFPRNMAATSCHKRMALSGPRNSWIDVTQVRY